MGLGKRSFYMNGEIKEDPLGRTFEEGLEEWLEFRVMGIVLSALLP